MNTRSGLNSQKPNAWLAQDAISEQDEHKESENDTDTEN